MSIAKRAFNNLFWISLSEVTSKGLTFLGTIYLARVLGKAGFGLFSLALAVGVYLWAIVDLGVLGYGTREVARNRQQAAELYSLLNSIRFVLALGLFLLFFAALYFINLPIEKKSILLTGCFFIVAYSLSPDWVFQGLEKMRYIALGRITTAVLFLGGVYMHVKGPSGTVIASAIYSFSFLVGSLILMLTLYIKVGIPFRFTLSWGKWLSHSKESFYFAINRAFNTTSIQIPVFFMGIWSTAEGLGTFSAPQRLTSLVTNAGALVIAALYPLLSNLYIVDKEAFRKTQGKFQKLLIIISIPVCIIGTIFSKEIIVFFYGLSYADSGGIFSIFIWLSFLMLLRFGFGNSLLSAGFHKFNMFATGGGVIIVILFSLFFIPKYSYYGAVAALLAGELVTLTLMIRLFNRKLYGTDLFRDFLIIKVLLAGLITAFVIKITRFSLLPAAIIGILAYGIFSLCIGIVNKDTFGQLWNELFSGQRKQKQ